ncbi:MULTISPECIES: ABC transporter permease [unclassified Burkholderia]|uniref:ABC transporter permease n=1 Tax=unclassified Burkholderia TaxID=2613784 RepID=UPI000F584B94|nr:MULTISPECIES: ABC transporter permease subunit [unclassified Burkholderia]RQR69816.1 ABC transporter permease subunit [Burkholderia sp. Bp9012]RQR73309.1 ABC transporter permease subunit [Burkholderia sp. Bp9011]RQR85168.1 ABC transporter permease subunit [Burkholderia sp. Bp9010]RQZ40292.1 ABC transporter permease subunit [Burkholderia sp. Bp9099]
MNFNIVIDNLRLFLWTDGDVATGLWLTVQLLLISLAFALVLALPLAVMRISRSRWLSTPVWLFTYVFRGSPLLVQMYVIYYGLAEVEFVRHSWLWTYLQEAYVCAWVAFGLNTAAYSCEIFAGALKATPSGEVEAAVAIGMSKWGRLRYVIYPSALRRAMQAYCNEVVFTLHGTALASGITLLDMGGVARAISMQYAAPFEPYLFALLLYSLCTFVILRIFRALERRYMAHVRPRGSERTAMASTSSSAAKFQDA